MATWIASNLTTLGAAGAVVTFLWPVIQFVLTRKREQRAAEFEIYHRLIRELVAPDPASGSIWIDRQVAAVFELRHFPRYYEVTTRILEGLKEKWSSSPEFKWPGLLTEVDLTLAYIQRHKNYLPWVT